MNNKKITELNSYSAENTLESIRNYKRKRKIRRRSIAITVSGFFIIMLASIPIIKNIRLADKFDEEAVELTEQLESVRSEKKSLNYKVSLLEDDEYVAKLARKELNLSKANEILINLPEVEESNLQAEEKSE
ncbi:MAG: septum formation initiator family protein [Atopostipes sp.]|nr:septum formation initiator family protein [Atopostipes sp.]